MKYDDKNIEDLYKMFNSTYVDYENLIKKFGEKRLELLSILNVLSKKGEDITKLFNKINN